MSVINDLVTDQRVDRHCRELQGGGYEVVLVGRRLAGGAEVRRPYRTERMELKHVRGKRFYAEYNRELYRLLLRERPDVVWVNDSDTLVGGWLAARKLGCPLVMDAHEIFPELPEVVGRPLVRMAWRLVNGLLLPKCTELLTVCESFAEYYAEHYGVRMTVVRNVRECDVERMPKGETGRQPMLLYQGAVNEGRGVDWAIDAMGLLPECRLVVAGGGDLMEEMKEYAKSKPWGERVTFLGRLEPEVLNQLTPQADVGLLMLEDRGLSYRLTLPNRVGDFVAAGVPMVASNMPETARVIERYGVGELMERPGAEALAEAVGRLLERWRPLDAEERRKRFAEARRDMDWKREREKLLEVAARVCG